MFDEVTINKIYNETIETILSNIDEKYKNEVSIAYKDYLTKVYLNFEIKGKSVEELVPVFINLEISKWKNIDQNVKLSEFLTDEAFNHIKQISNTGYKYALAKINQRILNQENIELTPTIDEETAEKNILILQQLLSKVKPFHDQLAKNFVSEGIIDFSYASGKTEYMSLRIGRMYR